MSPKNRLLFACLDLIRRRLILKRLLVNLVLLGYIGLFFFLCIKLLIEPDQIHSSIIYLLVGFVGAGLTWILVLRVRKSYSQIDAANVIDRNCNLHDQIKSATWFINNNIDTVFTKVVISDSEKVIRGIDVEKVVPINMTQFLLKLGFLVISFAVVGFSVNGFPKELKEKMFSHNSRLNDSIAANPLDFESLNSEYVNIAERVKSAREEGSPPEKVSQINQDLREMMDEANLRAIMARDGMAELTNALEGR